MDTSWPEMVRTREIYKACLYPPIPLTTALFFMSIETSEASDTETTVREYLLNIALFIECRDYARCFTYLILVKVPSEPVHEMV